ncbi:ABC transporter permease [Ornithinimicrobium sp. W1665]|uniref:ABC transporter permease n=1 Tax=Ornithinimicrobium sp. W1665 TaxID=3416666 RepID=UPI003CFA8524
MPEQSLTERLGDSRTVQIGLVLGTLAAVIVVWHLGVLLLDVREFVLPSPLAVGRSLIDSWGLLLPHAYITLQETIYGFVIAVLVGVPLAAGIAMSPLIERVVNPLLVLSNAVPKIALAPLFLAWFGLDSTPRVLIAALLAIFPVVINTVVGLVEIEPGLILLARSTRAGQRRTFWRVRFPAALPNIMSGMKLGITLSLTGAVVGQFLGGNGGLGYVITNAQGNLQLDVAFASIVLLSVMGIALFYLVEFVEKMMIRK